MGSEMCIRDRGKADYRAPMGAMYAGQVYHVPFGDADAVEKQLEICLLYTSDAADERSSVDLGGRRIIKNKP